MTTEVEALWVLVSTYAAVAGLVFLVVYVALVGHPRDVIGWNVTTLAAAVTLAFTAIAFRAWLGKPINPWVWIAISAVIGITLTIQTALLVRENRRARRRRKQIESAEQEATRT